MLLDQNRPGQAQQGCRVGEHANDISATFDLLVHPFERVRQPDLPPVPAQKRGKGLEVGFGELLVDVVRVRSGKDRADDRGRYVLASLGDHREHVAHKVDSAALPAGALHPWRLGTRC